METSLPIAGWGMDDAWNAALLEQEVREMKPREKLWASELGGAPIDLYLKLRGTPLTNPPNPRAMRKFEAGNVYEWVVSLILKRAGILKDGQKWCETKYDGLLPVSGKADFIAGGVPNLAEAETFLDFLRRAEMPNVFLRGFDRVLKHIAEKYPQGLEEMPLEVKSISSYAMDILEQSRTPSKRHRMQIFHYLKAMGYKKGLLVLICRDDLRMMEFIILNPSSVELEYKAAIESVSSFHYSNTPPPKERLIIFDEDAKRFSKNLNVEWSGYLELLYGFKEPREYGEIYAKRATNWNRVLARVKQGKKMTDKNTLVLNEISEAGFSIDDIMSKFPADAVVEEEETV